MTQSNSVRFLDGGYYLYLTRLQPSHLERRYYCGVTNANLTQEVSAPTRYVLIDNLCRGVLMDYKQIGNLTAFVGNITIEFAYVGGVFGDIINGTANTLTVDGVEVLSLGNVGVIRLISMKEMFMLEVYVRYSSSLGSRLSIRTGTLTIHRELIKLLSLPFCM